MSISLLGVTRLKRWVLGLVLVLMVMAAGRYLFGYHLSSAGASYVQGEVLREQNYPGGRALLVAGPGGCSIELTRRVGPLWQGFGSGECGLEKPPHPFSWAGLRTCRDGGGKYCAEAVGGTFSDRRIAKIRMGDRVQDVADTGHFLFAGVVEMLGAIPPMQAMDAEGNVLYEASQDTAFEWRAVTSP